MEKFQSSLWEAVVSSTHPYNLEENYNVDQTIIYCGDILLFISFSSKEEFDKMLILTF